MPRRTRPKKRRGRSAPNEEPEALRAPDVIVTAPAGWQVRLVQPSNATKEYRCPGCNQEIRPETKHVVAWREEDAEGRRHWHLPCWKRSARA